MTKREFRESIASLFSQGRVIDRELPEELKHGRRKTFLYPLHSAANGGGLVAPEGDSH